MTRVGVLARRALQRARALRRSGAGAALSTSGGPLSALSQASAHPVAVPLVVHTHHAGGVLHREAALQRGYRP